MSSIRNVSPKRSGSPKKRSEFIKRLAAKSSSIGKLDLTNETLLLPPKQKSTRINFEKRSVTDTQKQKFFALSADGLSVPEAAREARIAVSTAYKLEKEIKNNGGRIPETKKGGRPKARDFTEAERNEIKKLYESYSAQLEEQKKKDRDDFIKEAFEEAQENGFDCSQEDAESEADIRLNSKYYPKYPTQKRVRELLNRSLPDFDQFTEEHFKKALENASIPHNTRSEVGATDVKMREDHVQTLGEKSFEADFISNMKTFAGAYKDSVFIGEIRSKNFQRIEPWDNEVPDFHCLIAIDKYGIIMSSPVFPERGIELQKKERELESFFLQHEEALDGGSDESESDEGDDIFPSDGDELEAAYLAVAMNEGSKKRTYSDNVKPHHYYFYWEVFSYLMDEGNSGSAIFCNESFVENCRSDVLELVNKANKVLSTKVHYVFYPVGSPQLDPCYLLSQYILRVMKSIKEKTGANKNSTILKEVTKSFGESYSNVVMTALERSDREIFKEA